MGQSRAKRKIPINPRMRGETGNKGIIVLPQMFPGNLRRAIFEPFLGNSIYIVRHYKLRRAVFEPSLGNSIYTEHYNGGKTETCAI